MCGSAHGCVCVVDGSGAVTVLLHVVVVLSSLCVSMSPWCVSSGESVLCLDGGGIRGLVQLEILRHIEELTHRSIVNLFDWIVGTSTGGILALGLVYGVCCLSKYHFKLLK